MLGLEDAIAQAGRFGAIGAFLSGAGPTVMALALKSEKSIGQAMRDSLEKAGLESVQIKVLSADNEGVKILRSLPKGI